MVKTEHRIHKKGWELYENTYIKNHLPFDIKVTVEINEERQLEIIIEADEELKGKLEEV